MRRPAVARCGTRISPMNKKIEKMAHNHTHNQPHEQACCSCGCGHSHEDRSGASQWLPVIASVVLLAGGLLLEGSGSAFFKSGSVRALWYAAAFLPVGIPVLREAWEALRARDWMNEFTLMLVAAVGAFCIGEYPEAVAVMLFYAVGEKLQDKAVDKAQARIRSLIDLRPETATVVRDGERTPRAAAEVQPGEEIEVVAGGRVPLDGQLLSAHAVFDTAALTGESLPCPKAQGEAVAAGMIAVGSPVRIRVEKPYQESALARMLDMVRDAASRKAPAELFIRRFARRYTPCVLILAVLLATVPPLYGELAGTSVGGFSTWLYRALVFLVVSCPCALVVSIPLGYFSGIGLASRRGILFKGGNYLDTMARVNTVVFDKTGTLTQGRFAVVAHSSTAAAERFGGLPALLAAIEAHSNHPLARAVTEWAQAQGAAVANVAHVEELAGLGMKAEADGIRILAGNARLLAQGGVTLPDGIPEEGAAVLCAVGKDYAGHVLLEDTARPEAAEAVAALKKEGVGYIGILSGDRENVVARLASRLSIGHFRGGLLPEGKVEAMERLKTEAGRVTAFVGDGINDAPVLAASHVGIALGAAGSDAAVETADVVIQSAGVEKVAEAIRIGRATRRIVRFNIAFALGVKAAVLLAGAFGEVGMWEAAIADTGVTLLCVANIFVRHSLTK